MHHDRGSFSLTKPELNALLAFACDDETRSHLHCLRFEPEQGRVLATDGHSLLCCVAQDSACKKKAFSVPLGVLQDARVLLRRKRQLLRVHLQPRLRLVQLRVFEDESSAEPLGTLPSKLDRAAEKFPPPVQIVLESLPREPVGQSYGIDGRLLGRFALLAKMGCPGLRYLGTAGDELGPVFYRGRYGATELTVALMPMRLPEVAR